MCVYSTEKPDQEVSLQSPEVSEFWKLLAFSSGVALATIYSDDIGLLIFLLCQI